MYHIYIQRHDDTSQQFPHTDTHILGRVMQGKAVRSGALSELCKNFPRVIWVTDFTIQDLYCISGINNGRIF